MCADLPEPSFDELPLELRLKCLANCDWQTLSRAACASRSTRALVSAGGCQQQKVAPTGALPRRYRLPPSPHRLCLPAGHNSRRGVSQQ